MNRTALRSLPLALAVVAAASASAPALRAQAGEYRVVRRTVLGGDGGWDYLTVDTAFNRLFISRGTHVVVVSLANDSVVGEIAGTAGVHGVALAYAQGHGFTTNGRDTSVTMFDLKTLRPIRTVKVTGRNPDAYVYDAGTGRVFTMNAGGNATALDAATGGVVGTVALGGKPEAAVADGHGHVWVNIEDQSEIQEFDARTLASLGHWKLEGCEEPSGLAFDAAGGRLFSVCSNRKMAVVDVVNGRTVTTVDIGEGPDGAGYDAGTRTAFSSNGEGTLTIVAQDGADRYRVAQTLPTQRGARTMAVDPRTHRIYLVTAEFGPAPAPTADNPRPRRTIVPGSFVLITVGRS